MTRKKGGNPNIRGFTKPRKQLESGGKEKEEKRRNLSKGKGNKPERT